MALFCTLLLGACGAPTGGLLVDGLNESSWDKNTNMPDRNPWRDGFVGNKPTTLVVPGTGQINLYQTDDFGRLVGSGQCKLYFRLAESYPVRSVVVPGRVLGYARNEGGKGYAIPFESGMAKLILSPSQWQATKAAGNTTLPYVVVRKGKVIRSGRVVLRPYADNPANVWEGSVSVPSKCFYDREDDYRSRKSYRRPETNRVTVRVDYDRPTVPPDIHIEHHQTFKF